jgi:Domain of unknown function (DUF4270)
LKRATLTPNRFIISTRSWPAKGLALFLILLVLGSCDDEIGLIGNKKPVSRFGVYFKEFDIPVTTIQTDSISSTAIATETLLCGTAVDPNFGKITAMFFTQFSPAISTKIDATGKSDFKVISINLNMAISKSYYVYGDTTDAQLEFSLHKISVGDFWIADPHHTTSTIPYESSIVATGVFDYVHDSIVSFRARNQDSNTADNPYDTVNFPLPKSFGEHLLDSAITKGLFSTNNTAKEWKYDASLTDSAFRVAFPGFAVKALDPTDRIIAFKSQLGSAKSTSRITLYYSYVKDGLTIRDKLYYYNSSIDLVTGYGFSNIVADRTGTVLEPLSQIDPADLNVDFNAPDDYCYMQAGSGLFAKLDLSEVRGYFDANPDTILNAAINGAELIVGIEPDATRHHLSIPRSLNLRVVGSSNKFFRTPLVTIGSSQIPDQAYANNYYCVNIGQYLDPLDDKGNRLAIPLSQVSTSERYYRAYISNFAESFIRTPEGFQPIQYLALMPNVTFGKYFHGLSFKKDKVKLRVYYTKTL